MSLSSSELLKTIASWAEVSAVLFTALGAVSGVVYVVASRPLRKTEARERLLLEKSVADANAEGGKANERAGKLEKAAADLTAENLRLAAIIAPRRLTSTQQHDLTALTKFSGRRIGIKSYANDIEGLVLASQILEALTQAHIPIEDNRLTMQSATSISVGVSIEGSDKEVVAELQKILGNLAADSTMPRFPARMGLLGITATVGFGVIETGPLAATIVVGVKPIK
jgi:hypothetical protein